MIRARLSQLALHLKPTAFNPKTLASRTMASIPIPKTMKGILVEKTGGIVRAHSALANIDKTRS
jgi:hypothetical protein